MATVALLPFLNMGWERRLNKKGVAYRYQATVGWERRWPRWIKKALHIGIKRLCTLGYAYLCDIKELDAFDFWKNVKSLMPLFNTIIQTAKFSFHTHIHIHAHTHTCISPDIPFGCIHQRATLFDIFIKQYAYNTAVCQPITAFSFEKMKETGKCNFLSWIKDAT